MNKNYIIALVVIIIAAGLFFFFRSQKKTEEIEKVHAEAFVKVTDLAQKVPISGLPQMASALKRYHAKHQKYPEQLELLYPEFIPYRPFIEEIEWEYVPQGDNFTLTKTIIRGNKQVAASIDKSMNPVIGSGMEIAAADKPAPRRGRAEQIEETEPLLALKPIETIQPIEPLETDEPEQEAIIEQPEIISMVEGEIGHGIGSDISQKMLVWRDKNGVLGFGNVIYPGTRNLTIYKNGNWINIKKPEPQPVAAPGSEKTPAKETKKPDKIATDFSNKYLVWKDKKGNIGYGNVQYPPFENIAYICVNGNWQKVVN